MDIYFERNYGKLYEEVENGLCEVFELKTSYGAIKHLYIKREIPIIINKEKYYDLVTPYGYGGPIILNYKSGYKEKLINEFDSEFKKYCEANNIVSEFIRFHPIIGNVNDFKPIYLAEKVRKTVGTNIKDFEDPITNEFSKSTRKTIRRALKSGITYRVIEGQDIKTENIDNFRKIYYSAMDRNTASEYYYFDDNYFSKCLEYYRDKIILVEVLYEGKSIASGFYFVYDKIIHAHLSGTLNEYLAYSPAYVIKYATVEWAKKNGIELIHYGGGTSNSEEDTLYKFKKKFGKNTEFDFYVGKKIWNKDIYTALCEHKSVDTTETDFFPLYRKN